MTLPLRSGRQRIIHASRRVGAVLNTARMEAGSSAIVFGAGGVGLNTIQGYVIAGARTIVAVDTHDSKLELAASGSVKSTPSSILVSAAW
jgi:Zn-dependent alcohol dehydrogenase